MLVHISTKMQYKTPQGISSTTFQPPVLDGSLLLPEMLALHAQNSASYPVFYYESPGPKGLASMDWNHTFIAIEVAREFCQTRLSIPDLSGRPIVAILAGSDTMTFFAVMQGLMQAGYIPFPISTRNSAAGVIHLLRMTNCLHLIAGHEGYLKEIVAVAIQDIGNLQVIDMPHFNDLYHSKHPLAVLLPSQLSRPGLDDIAIILHSSGSTRFPSPIFFTHRLVVQICTYSYYGEINLGNKIMAIHTLPLFHVLGFLGICMMVSSGVVLGIFPPSDLPMVPTPDVFLSSIKTLDCDIILTVPSFLQEWSKSRDTMSKLQSSLIFVAGGILSKEAGDILQANKVKFRSVYGLTEAGGVSLLHIPPQSIGWDWHKNAPHINLVLVPEGEDIFRVFITTSPTLCPAVLNTKINGLEAFDTKDLVIRHPTNPDYWKIVGRADDLILHSNGEKTNPVPIENTLLGDKHIAAAVMFGTTKFQTGVLILPKPEFTFDPVNVEKLTEFRNIIWNTVIKANMQAPQHSRIYKEMILVARPSQPFQMTTKGTVQRSNVLQVYANDIERLYDTVASLSLIHIPLPTIWDLENTLTLVRTVVNEVLDHSIQDDTDIFDIGADSLAAMSIRNTITHCLRESKTIPIAALRHLPQSLVFENPTITVLSTYIHSFIVQFTKNPSSESQKDDHYFVDLPLLAESGKTIVKLREGPGVPLIMIHGGDGTFFSYSSYSEKFNTAVWTLQVTPDTPLTTLNDMAMFYHSKIKEQQQSGPYRLAAYSSTSILGIALARIFENSGDTVAQLALLDHTPLLFVYSANRLGNPNPRLDTNHKIILNAAIDGLETVLQHDNGSSTKEKVYSAWLDAARGLPAPKSSQIGATTFRDYLSLVVDFVYTLTTDVNGVSSLDMLVEWTSGLKAPMTVYVAEKGVLVMIEEENRENWTDLGAQYLTGARVVKVTGGHMEMLMDEILIEDLQYGF